MMADGVSVHDPLGQPPNVLGEHNPEGNWDAPDLADRHRLYALESRLARDAFGVLIEPFGAGEVPCTTGAERRLR